MKIIYIFAVNDVFLYAWQYIPSGRTLYFVGLGCELEWIKNST